MDLTYIIIAAAILVLTWLLSGSSRDTKTVLGAELRSKPAGVIAIKKAVPAIEKSPGAQPRPAGLMGTIRHMQGTSEKVKQLARNGQKIEAIKLLRERTGLGLKEAKDLVDRLG